MHFYNKNKRLKEASVKNSYLISRFARPGITKVNVDSARLLNGNILIFITFSLSGCYFPND